MSDQTWKIPVSPAQRFALLNLSHAEGQKLQGQRGRRFRRFLRAFGLTLIADAIEANPVPEGKPVVNVKLSSSREPALFALTAENADYALDLAEQEHVPAVERALGPLWDALEEAKKAGAAWQPPEGVPDYDPATEDWAPVTETPVEERIAAFLRFRGETRAAELVERGGWDQPLLAEPVMPRTPAGAA